MKSINKLLIGLATVTTIIAPLVPKTVNLNFSMSGGLEKPRPKQCSLAYTTYDSQGVTCGYKCEDGKSANSPTRPYRSSKDCSKSITVE
jgi:hypothetical protein